MFSPTSCIVYLQILISYSLKEVATEDNLPVPWNNTVAEVASEDDLPVNWTNSAACNTDNPYYWDLGPTTVCDPFQILSEDHRMITADLLDVCQKESLANTKFFLFLTSMTKLGEGVYGNVSTIEGLLKKAKDTYELTKEESVVFLVAAMDPIHVSIDVWTSPSLDDAITEKTIENATLKEEEIFNDKQHFPSTVNKFIYFYCDAVRAPLHRPSAWDALTYLWMIIVIMLITAITALVIHLIMVRQQRLDKSLQDADTQDLRTNLGRPSVCPLPVEMEEFGSPRAYRPSGNLLLSSSDVTVVQQTSSTANLLVS